MSTRTAETTSTARAMTIWMTERRWKRMAWPRMSPDLSDAFWEWRDRSEHRPGGGARRIKAHDPHQPGDILGCSSQIPNRSESTCLRKQRRGADEEVPSCGLTRKETFGKR
jgi:hypothetical protein